MAAKETSGLYVSKKFKVHILIRNHRNSLVFGYYQINLVFAVVSLIHIFALL